MAKPWADIITQQSGNDYAEEVVSDVGEHLRTRPAPGVTPPGGGRPSRDTTDNAPIAYSNTGDREFGLGDHEELYAPPPPTRPEDGKLPQQPQEFEAVWMDRYLKRTQVVVDRAADVGSKKLILPASYNSATHDDADIVAMQQQMRTMQHALHAAMERKAAEAEQAKAKAAAEPTGGYLQIIVPMPNGEPTATLFVPGKMGQPFDIGAALALLQVLGK